MLSLITLNISKSFQCPYQISALTSTTIDVAHTKEMPHNSSNIHQMRQATRAHTHTHKHTHTQWKPEAKKPPIENNPEENPEDVEHTNPQTTHPQPN